MFDVAMLNEMKGKISEVGKLFSFLIALLVSETKKQRVSSSFGNICSSSSAFGSRLGIRRFS